MNKLNPAIVAVLLLVVADGRASAQRDLRQPLTPDGRGIIRGRILDAQSGEPVFGANVILEIVSRRNPELPAYAALSGVDGAYEFSGVSPADYLVGVEAPGYVRTYLGQTSIDDVTTGAADGAMLEIPVRVRGGQIVSNVDIRVERASWLSGRITGASGESLGGIELELLRRVYRPGGLTPAVVAFAEIEQSGTFGLQIPPGEYYIRAYTSSDIRPVRDGSIAYRPTFFPGVTSVTEAEAVVLRGGEERSDLKFQLATVSPVTVAGKILDPGGPLPTDATVELSSIAPGSGGERPSAIVASDGSFRFDRVVPGEYVLLVEDPADTSKWLGVRRQIVVTTALTGLEISPVRGAHIEGRLARSGSGPLPFDPRGIQLAFEYDAASGMTGGGYVDPDGTFTIDTPPGSASVRVSRIPPPWIVKSILVDGVDATDARIDLITGRLRRVEIVITDRTSALTGTVRDERDRLTPYSLVVVFPADRAKWSAPRLIQTGFSQHDGTYEVGSLPDGEYRIVAVGSLPPDAWRDPRVLDRLSSVATPVRLQEGQQQSVGLQQVSTPQGLFER